MFGGQLGSHYLHEKHLSGPDIQVVLSTLGAEDPELLDRALYQGTLLSYLFEKGVTGLSAAELPRATGSGFYNGFEFTWRDLAAREPIAIPSFSAPTPFDIFKYETGLKWGVLVGIKDGVVGTAQDVLSLFQVETYTQLYDLLAAQIWDEKWRYEMGASFATALHAYLQDVGNDGAFEIGVKLGRLLGQAIVEILLGILTGGVVKIASKALRGTRWGAALLDFAEDVAHAMPWREPRVIDEPGFPAAVERPATPERAATRERSMGPEPSPGVEPLATVAPPAVTTAPATRMRAAAPGTGVPDVEASVATSSRMDSDQLTPRQIANEKAYVEARPEIVKGEAPNRKAQVGEHEIVEKLSGRCERRSDNPVKFPCPLPMQGGTPIEKVPYESGRARAKSVVSGNERRQKKFEQLEGEFAKMDDPRSQQFLRLLGDIELPDETLDSIFGAIEEVPRGRLRRTFQEHVYKALADRSLEFPKERIRINEALSELHPSQKRKGGEFIEAARAQIIALNATPFVERTVKPTKLPDWAVGQLNDLLRLREGERLRAAFQAQRSKPDLKEVATGPVSEDLGLIATDASIAQQFPRATPKSLLPSGNQSGVFDRVYSFDEGGLEHWIIGEAKGGENPQPSVRKIDGKYYEQGTMEHTRDTIAAMAKRGDPMAAHLSTALGSESARVFFVKVTAQVTGAWKRSLASLLDLDALDDLIALDAELLRVLEPRLSNDALDAALEIVVKVWSLKE